LVKEAFAVGQELRQARQARIVAGGLFERSGGAAARRHRLHRAAELGDEDDAGRTPGAAVEVRAELGEGYGRSSRDLDTHQLAVGAEGDRLAIRGPERK
jgi:hypothetical protein